MLDNLVGQLQNVANSIHNNLYFVLFFIAVLWGIQLLNWSCGYQLNRLGVRPRSGTGVVGIICSPMAAVVSRYFSQGNRLNRSTT